jgi:hypothetical protein
MPPLIALALMEEKPLRSDRPAAAPAGAGDKEA